MEAAKIAARKEEEKAAKKAAKKERKSSSKGFFSKLKTKVKSSSSKGKPPKDGAEGVSVGGASDAGVAPMASKEESSWDVINEDVEAFGGEIAEN
jgi:hypothetical protein